MTRGSRCGRLGTAVLVFCLVAGTGCFKSGEGSLGDPDAVAPSDRGSLGDPEAGLRDARPPQARSLADPDPYPTSRSHG